MAESIKITCPCLFGLESVLAFEAKRMGANDVTAADGRITFSGGLDTAARANLRLRTAERVQILLGSFVAKTFEELFQGVLALPLEDFIGKSDAFPVKGYSLNSALHSVPDCQSIVKKAAVKRLEKVYHQAWFEETGPVHQLQFSILKDSVLVMLDTSGAGLHKRGYRREATEAPIKETLAAGIIDFARVRNDSVVYDPFCGSGTFLIEAAMRAMNIAPGLSRSFACEKWGVFSSGVFKTERESALSEMNRDVGFEGYGFDIDPEAVRLSAENARKAGVADKLVFEQAPIKDFRPSTQRGIVLCNPPYGERLLEVKQSEEIYRQMGAAFPKREGFGYYVISSHEEFERFFGRPANRRRKLYNGMIKCQLYMYF